ncbi:hypothetical protein LEMLEM_LOCUS11025 [Lemmus lemmus]
MKPHHESTRKCPSSSSALSCSSHTVPSGDEEFLKKGLHLCSYREVVPCARVKYFNDKAAVWELIVLLEVSAINPPGPRSE